MPNDSRQAGALEITSEMIDAGIDVLVTKDRDYDDDAGVIVSNIYRAMFLIYQETSKA